MRIHFYTACLFLLLSVTFSASAQEILRVEDSRFPVPLKFNVSLPEGYQDKPDKQYWLLFDFHYYGHSYLTGMHDWLSHNGEWPWPETIIVTPKRGNPVGKLFDSSGKTTPLIDFFADELIPAIEARYRTSGFRIMSGFRVNGTLVLSTLLRKPELFDAYFATSPELKGDYAGILSTLDKQGFSDAAANRYLLFSHGDSVKEVHQQQENAQLHRLLKKQSEGRLQYQYLDLHGRAFMSQPLLTLLQGIEHLYQQHTKD